MNQTRNIGLRKKGASQRDEVVSQLNYRCFCAIPAPRSATRLSRSATKLSRSSKNKISQNNIKRAYHPAKRNQ